MKIERKAKSKEEQKVPRLLLCLLYQIGIQEEQDPHEHNMEEHQRGFQSPRRSSPFQQKGHEIREHQALQIEGENLGFWREIAVPGSQRQGNRREQ